MDLDLNVDSDLDLTAFSAFEARQYPPGTAFQRTFSGACACHAGTDTPPTRAPGPAMRASSRSSCRPACPGALQPSLQPVERAFCAAATSLGHALDWARVHRCSATHAHTQSTQAAGVRQSGACSKLGAASQTAPQSCMRTSRAWRPPAARSLSRCVLEVYSEADDIDCADSEAWHTTDLLPPDPGTS